MHTMLLAWSMYLAKIAESTHSLKQQDELMWTGRSQGETQSRSQSDTEWWRGEPAYLMSLVRLVAAQMCSAHSKVSC